MAWGAGSRIGTLTELLCRLDFLTASPLPRLVRVPPHLDAHLCKASGYQTGVTLCIRSDNATDAGTRNSQDGGTRRQHVAAAASRSRWLLGNFLENVLCFLTTY